MKKHLNQIKEVFVISFAALILVGCSKEKPNKNYVAKVNNAYLTREELASIIDTSDDKNFESEIIRNWINRELLYQEAVKKGIVKEKEYKNLLEDSKKELASALLVKKLYAREKILYNTNEIVDYYHSHKRDFRLFYDAYQINRIDFKNEDKAVQFRSIVIEGDWDKALNVFVGDTSIIRNNSKILLYDYEINPHALYKVIQELKPQEVSIVLKNQNGDYILVQLLHKFDKGSIPPLDAIKDRVIKRYIAEKKRNLLKKYIRDLYSNNNIEVKK